MISASHNPYEDNGIKLFAADGFKLDDDTEHEIEAGARAADPPPPARIGRVRRLHGALEDYLRELHTRFAELDLSGTRVLLDCANGATFRAAPEIFRRLGAEVDGDRRPARRAQHQRRLRLDAPRRGRRARCAAGDYDVAFAFDGDGDRVLAVDGDGAVVDGDELIAMAALHLHRERAPARQRRRGHGDDQLRLPRGDGGGRASRWRPPPVGDRYVLDELRRRGWALGGEQSGHIIDLGFGTVRRRDRQRAADARGARRRAICVERDAMEKLPQRLVNIRAADRRLAEPRAMDDAGVGAGDRARADAGSAAAGACSSARRAPSR